MTIWSLSLSKLMVFVAELYVPRPITTPMFVDVVVARDVVAETIPASKAFISCGLLSVVVSMVSVQDVHVRRYKNIKEDK